MTLDDFMKRYLTPFCVDNINLEEVDSIYFLYREKMLQANNVEEANLVASKFRFLAWGVKENLKQIIMPSQFNRIKRYFNNKKVTALQYANFTLPPIMLHARLISKEYDLPEYYAALQYVASQLEKNHD